MAPSRPSGVFVLGNQGVLDPFQAFLSGGFIFGIFFIATDPISASQTDLGKWIFSAILCLF